MHHTSLPTHDNSSSPSNSEIKTNSRLSVHANFIFWPIALLYRLFPYPELLLFLTTLACTLCGLGIYALSKFYFGDSLLVLLPPIIFWISPIVHDSNLFDFHVITIYTCLLVWVLWAFATNRLLLAYILLFLFMISQEDTSLIVIMLGINFLLSGHKRRGILLMSAGLLYFVLILKLFHHLNTNHTHIFISGTADRYSWLGSSIWEIITNIVTKPLTILRFIMQPEHSRLVIYLLISGGIVCLKSWRILLMMLPHLMMGLLSSNVWVTSITGTYYWITSLTIIIVATIMTVSNKIKNDNKRVPWELSYLLGVTVFLSIILTPAPYGLFAKLSDYKMATREELDTIKEIKNMIPEKAIINVQNNIGAFFAHRYNINGDILSEDKIEYKIFHFKYNTVFNRCLSSKAPAILLTMTTNEFIAYLHKLLKSKEWDLLLQKNKFYVFKKNKLLQDKSQECWDKFEEDLREYAETRSISTKEYNNSLVKSICFINKR